MQSSPRPIDAFVKRSMGVLQKEYLVIGKTRVSRLTSWAVLAFFLGMTLTIGFLASRTGTLEESEAAKSPVPKWSSWSKAQEGTCEGKTSATQQCKTAKLRKGKTITAQGFQTRNCVKNCQGLAAGSNANQAVTYQASADFNTYPGQQSSGLSDPNRWSYLDSSGNQLTYNASNPNAGNASAWQGSEQYLLIANNWQHPGQNANSIRRWKAPQAGAITISSNGNVYDANTDCGDGVNVYAKKNGAALWSATIANGNTAGVAISGSALANVAVAGGDYIDFEVSKGSKDNYCDSTHIDPIVAFTPQAAGSTGNLYVTVKKDGLEVPATDCLINPLNGNFTGPSGTTPFTCLPHWYDKSGSTPTVSAGHYTFAYANGGPAGFTFQNTICNPSDCNVPSGGTLNAYYNFTSATDTLTVSKTFFGITPFTPTLLLDGKPPTTTTDTTAIWSGILAGTHTLSTTLAPDTKAFYATCTNADNCIGGFVDAGVGSGTGGTVKTITTPSFTHTAGQNDFVNLIYASANGYLATDEGFWEAHGLLGAGLLGPDLTIDDKCSVTFETNMRSNDPEYSWLQEVAKAWSQSNVKVEIVNTVKGETQPVISSTSDIYNNVGDDPYYILRIDDIPGMGQYAGYTKRFGIVDNTMETPMVSFSSDIVINIGNTFFPAPFTPDYQRAIRNVAAHEIGHALGLAHKNTVSSIMYSCKGCSIKDILTVGVDFPSTADLEAVNGLYLGCGSKQAALSLTFVPNPAPLVNAVCKGYPNPSHWQIETIIQEAGKSVGATLNTFDAVYYDKSGGQVGAFTDSFNTLQGGTKGFTTNHVNAGQSVNATLCQVPWSPEQLGSLKMTVKGTDDKGNAIQATNRINF